MSIKLTAKAWETNQSGNDLLVLLALCDFSNDEGMSFPSLKTLCNKAKVSKTTLSYILKAYQEIGVLTRTRRTRDNNSDTSTLYQINHLNIDINEYQKAYQKARNYTAKSDESSQCEHPSKDTNVNTGSENVNTLSANCEHLEPSSINHQVINQEEKRESNSNYTNANFEDEKNIPHSFSKNENKKFEDEKLNPREVIEAYREKISQRHSNIQEPSSFNQIALKKTDIPKMLIGIDNYAKALKLTNTKVEKLFFFIRDGIYLDYQEEQVISKNQNMQYSYQTKQDKTKAFIDDYYNRKAQAKENKDSNILDAEVL
ncbi:helix-turn-helix domain-containing protein [Aliarcobacter butzleri]|uniref:helix-turn-helix domain-containing protein n=1 Tax=Aliarcobacter butzleri TaxID=28197 RepID=UPI0021B39F56|nr:helix-turn-helix domain-containing protein [Aliarcobacter butzleri]MCT7551967.1 helix-turn-helix domain-containing protein [Aliarcobacter butzleri]